MADLIIPDVSEFQGDIDWANFGSDAAIVRINYGNTKVDGKADRNIEGARSRCRVRGWYTYLTQGEDPVAQAYVLVRVLQVHGGLKANEFIVCDDEEGSGDQSGRSTAFLNEVDSKLNAPDSVDWWYSGLNFSIAHNMNASKGHRWIAAYGVPEPIASHSLWQYTSSGSIAGVVGAVDLSIWHGDIDSLIRFLGGTTGGFMALSDQQQIDMYQNTVRVLTLLADGHQSMIGPDGTLVDIPSTWPEWLRDQTNHLVAKVDTLATPSVDVNALAAQLASNPAFVQALGIAIAHVLGSALDKA